MVVLGDTESAFGRTWALIPRLLLILTRLLQFGAVATDFRAPIRIAAPYGARRAMPMAERGGRAGVRVRDRVTSIEKTIRSTTEREILINTAQLSKFC